MWQVYSRLNTEPQFTLDATANCEVNYANRFFIIETIYTATRATKFLFDSIGFEGSAYLDTQLPEITKIELVNQSTILLHFSENVDHANTQIHLNNQLASTKIKLTGQYTYQFDLSQTVEAEDTFVLRIMGAKDAAGNQMDVYTAKLIYVPFLVRRGYFYSSSCIVLDASLPLSSFVGAVLVNNKPASVKIEIKDTTLRAYFDELPVDSAFEIRFTNLISERGDTISEFAATYYYHQPKPFDLVVSEIMFDPVPAIKLPETEYVELYNRSSFPLFLADITLQIGSRFYQLPPFTLQAQHFLLIYSGAKSNPFSALINSVNVSSLALTNSGNTIRLWHESTIIGQTDYCPLWHSGEFKADGGWSVERRDLNNPEDAANWQSSESEKGGTPGVLNSVNKSVSNQNTPTVQRVFVTDTGTIEIEFSELVQVSESEQVLVDEKVAAFDVSQNWVRTICIDALVEIDTANSVTLKVDGFYDLFGDPMEAYSVSVSKPVTPRAGMLVINEMMFNPKEGGCEYVEIYNPTAFTVDLSDVCMAKPTLSDSPGTAYSLAETSTMLGPNAFALFIDGANLASTSFDLTEEVLVLSPKTYPALPNDAASLMLITKSGTLIDSVYYSNKYHFDLLADEKGVALERINPLLSGAVASNWHSASLLAGFGTPGRLNSQSCLADGADDNGIRLSCKVISPNNDGTDDYTVLYLGEACAGEFMNVKVLDSNGVVVSALLEHALVGKSDELVWHGTDDFNAKLHTGLYLIMVEHWQPGVASEIERLPVVVSP